MSKWEHGSVPQVPVTTSLLTVNANCFNLLKIIPFSLYFGLCIGVGVRVQDDKRLRKKKSNIKQKRTHWSFITQLLKIIETSTVV